MSALGEVLLALAAVLLPLAGAAAWLRREHRRTRERRGKIAGR